MTSGRVLGGAIFAVSLALIASCSSVPDVVFVDDGTTSSTSSGGSSGQPEPPDWSCPTKPPPAGAGICCGNRICLRCSQSDCSKCEQEGCAGTVSAACCRKNPGQMQCQAHDGC